MSSCRIYASASSQCVAEMICVHPCGRWCDCVEIFGVNLNILVDIENYVEKPEAQLSAGCGAIAGLNELTLGILQHPAVRLP